MKCINKKVLLSLVAAGVLGISGTAFADINISFGFSPKHYRPIAKVQNQNYNHHHRPPMMSPDRPPEPPHGKRPPMSEDKKFDKRRLPPKPFSDDKRPDRKPYKK